MSGIFDFLQVLGQMGTSMQPSTPGAAPAGLDPKLSQLASSLGVDPSVLASTLGGTEKKTATADVPALVWMGKRINQRPNPVLSDNPEYIASRNAARDAGGAGGRVGLTADAAANLPFTWNEKERAAAYARVSEAVGQPIQSFQEFNSIWTNAVKTAQQSWAATEGGKKGSPLTVWDVFDLAKREGSKYGYSSGGGGGGGGGSRTTVSTSSSVEKLSDGEMWQILKSTATQALGRAPTNDELQRFASRANHVASSNPTKTRTVTTSSSGGSHSKSTTTHGASAGDFQLAAEDMVNANPEAGAVQAATTYADALFQGLSSPV